MVYGVLQLINFAHSEVFMFGTFAVAWVVVFFHGTGSADQSLGQHPRAPGARPGRGDARRPRRSPCCWNASPTDR